MSATRRSSEMSEIKTEKCCESCIYGKFSEHEEMIMCIKSIRYVKKNDCIRVAFHSSDYKCRKWKSAETGNK